MKIKFRNSDGVIVAFGAFNDVHDDQNFSWEDFDGELPNPRPDFNKREGPGLVVERQQIEKDAITDSEKKFTAARLKIYVNAGATQAEKFDRLLNVVAKLAIQLRETDV